MKSYSFSTSLGIDFCVYKAMCGFLITTGCTKIGAVGQHCTAQASVFESSIVSCMEALYKCTVYMHVYNKQT